METYRTEEEQVEAIKKWWRENGQSTVIGIAVALSLVFGWKGWQNHISSRAAEASVVFDNLLQADAGVQVNGGKLTTAKHLANTLKSEFSGYAYAQFGAMMLAKYAVNAGDYATAEQELQWVLDKKPELSIKGQAQLRLAKIKLATADFAAALALLNAVQDAGYSAQVEEIRGDIQLAQGNAGEALASYEKARTINRSQELPVNNPMLDMKIADLRQALPANSAPAVDLSSAE